jgi:hypothetical protein
MRNPLRTEAEAFSFVLVFVALAVVVGLAVWLAGPKVGFAVFLALTIGIGVGLFLKSDPKVTEPAVWDRHRPDGVNRILVIANETVAGTALRDEVVSRARDGASEVLVVTPALNSRIRHWTSDEDGARAQAQDRLEASLASLGASGVRAKGQVGDDDPLQAIGDALRTFPADEIIVSTHPPGRSNWLERDLVGRARETYPCKITHVVVDLEAEREAS